MRQGTRANVLSDFERSMLLIVQEGIPLCPEPYREIAERLGTSEERVLATLDQTPLRNDFICPQPRSLPGIWSCGEHSVWSPQLRNGRSSAESFSPP